MGLLNRLWSSSTIVIPSYEQGSREDDIDLQIRSLLYMFKRCEIVLSKPFSDTSMLLTGPGLTGKKSNVELRQAKSHSGTDKPVNRETEKLDLMYNKVRFDQVLYTSDEHRILIDWTKNKFRSLCILSGFPSELSALPKFDSPNYAFSILSPSASDDEYVELLSKSNIYAEHASVSMDTRRKIVQKALEFARTGASPSKPLSKNDRALVIRYYLNKLASEVQVERLYRGSIKAKLQASTNPAIPPVPSVPPVPPVPDLSPGSPTHLSIPPDIAPIPRRTRNSRESPERHASPDRVSPERQPDRRGDRLSDKASPERSPERSGRMSPERVDRKSPSRASPDKLSSEKLSSPKVTIRKMKSSPALPAAFPSLSPFSSPMTSPIASPPGSPRSKSPTSRGRTSLNSDLASHSPSSNIRNAFKAVPELKPKPSLLLDGSELGDNEKKELMAQARIAVKSRLDRERRVLFNIN